MMIAAKTISTLWKYDHKTIWIVFGNQMITAEAIFFVYRSIYRTYVVSCKDKASILVKVFMRKRNGSYGRSKETLWHCYGFYVFAQAPESKRGSNSDPFSCRHRVRLDEILLMLPTIGFERSVLQLLCFYPRTEAPRGGSYDPYQQPLQQYFIISCCLVSST